MNTNKMYILIRDDVDLGHALLAAAHAALSGYLTFVDFEHSPEYRMFFGAAKDPSDTELWAAESFRKVICKVTPAEFEKAKTYGKNMQDYRIMTESGLNNMEVAIVFRPVESDKLPKFLKFLKLYRELKKCILLCSNCHRLEHTGRCDDKLIAAAKAYKGRKFTD